VQRFRADLVAYLDSLPVGELAGLLGELPVITRITLMHEREVLADRRTARAARRAGPPAPLADPGGDQWVTYWLTRRRLAGAVAERRLAERLRRPVPPPSPARLSEAQAIPATFLAGFAEGLLDRRAELLAQGQPATAARALAVSEAVQAFHADAGGRGWTIDSERLSSLAHDVLGLEEEYRDRHGYPPEQARATTVGEVLEGERAREELPASWLRQARPPERSQRWRGEERGADREDR
jgi:hypothetical protein